MHPSLYLPNEIWELILDCLDTQALLNFQHTCHPWRQIVLSYVINGRLKNRAFVSLHCFFLKKKILANLILKTQIQHRLKYEGKGLHHRRSIWNTLCIHANAGAFIIGIGTYTEDFEDLFNASLNITFDRSTTTINFWDNTSGEMVSTQTLIIDTNDTKHSFDIIYF